jgi:uncharacterized protein involved in type VI secretion and phage assembly
VISPVFRPQAKAIKLGGMFRNFSNCDQFRLQIKGLDTSSIRVLQFTLKDFAISKHYAGQVKIYSSYTLTLNKLAQQHAKLELLPNSYIHGIITKLEALGSNGQNNYYNLTIESPLYWLKRHSPAQVFVYQNLQTIIQKIFNDVNYSYNGYKIIAKQKIPTVDFQVQMQESRLTFLERLLSQQGWFYYFTQTEEQALLTITDDINILPAYPQSLEFCPQNGMNRPEFSVYEFIPTYDQTETFFGKTDARDLQLNRINLTGFDDKYNGDYRILGINLQGDQNDNPDAEIPATFTAEFTAIKASAQYAPPLIPSPKLFHTLPAEIWGIGGLFPRPDEQGSYQIKLPFDLTEDFNVSHSTPVKMQRSYVAPYSPDGPAGTHFPLKNGTQVGIGFTDGDLKAPIIIGVLSDQEHASPIFLNNLTKSTIRTFANNELTMEDMPCREHVLLSNNQENYLLMTNEEDKPLTLESKPGKITASSGKDLNLTGNRILTEIAGDQTTSVKNKQNLQVGNIIKTVGHESLQKAQAYDVQTIDGNISLRAKLNLKKIVQNELQVSANKNLNLIAQKNNLHFYATDNLSAQSSGEDLTIGNDKAQLHITKSGEVNCIIEKLVIAAPGFDKHHMAEFHTEPNIPESSQTDKVENAESETVKKDIIKVAKEWKDTPYAFAPPGGENHQYAGMNAKKGTQGGGDCGGVTHAIYKEAGYDYGYVTVEQFVETSGNHKFKEISFTEAKPGDVVTWYHYPHVHHMAIINTKGTDELSTTIWTTHESGAKKYNGTNTIKIFTDDLRKRHPSFKVTYWHYEGYNDGK